MPWPSRPLLWGLTLMLLAGCMPSQRELRLERDLEEMKRRLATVERGLVEERRDPTGQRVEQNSRQLAGLQAGLDNLRVELQGFYGRLDDLQRADGDLQSQLTLLQEEWSLKAAALEDRLERLELTVTQAPAAGTAAGSPEELYEEALRMIQQEGRFEQGRKRLTAFVERHPDHELKINALYWIGEAYYGEKKYENAILQFQDVIQQHPEHPKAAPALLKQGLAFHALGDVRNARVILEKVVRDYPQSEAAAKARERLKAWEEG